MSYYNNPDWISSPEYQQILVEIISNKYDINLNHQLTECLTNKNPYLSIKSAINEIPNFLKKFEWIQILSIANGKFRTIENIPKSVRELSMYSCDCLLTIAKGDIPDSVNKLSIQYTQLRSVDCANLPKTITYLKLDFNNIKTIQNLSHLSNLVNFSISGNKLERIGGFYESVKYINASDNMLTHFQLPIYVEKLDLKMNQLKNFSRNHYSLQCLDISGNNISKYILEELHNKFDIVNFESDITRDIQDIWSNQSPDYFYESYKYGQFYVKSYEPEQTNTAHNATNPHYIIHKKNVTI